MSAKKIACIVDDDDIFQFTAIKTIELTGQKHEVISFKDGERAFDFIKNNKDDADKLPDVMFLDINMPIMNGWEFMEAYKAIKEQLSKKINIYIITSSIDFADIEKAKQDNNIVEFISKPLAIAKYMEILNASN